MEGRTSGKSWSQVNPLPLTLWFTLLTVIFTTPQITCSDNTEKSQDLEANLRGTPSPSFLFVYTASLFCVKACGSSSTQSSVPLTSPKFVLQSWMDAAPSQRGLLGTPDLRMLPRESTYLLGRTDHCIYYVIICLLGCSWFTVWLLNS